MTTRARRRLAVQTAAAVTSAVLLVGGAAWLLVGHEQRRDVDRQTAAAVDRADDVIDPPDDIYLFLQAPNGALTGTPGSPPGLPDLLELAATSATGQTRVTTIERAGRDFQIRTERRPNGLLQAAYDLTGKEQERHRLLAALGIAESIGVAAAALVGALLGQRAVAPLGEALTRQRRFVAEAAHELRTPLTLLHTRVQLFERAARRRGDDVHQSGTVANIGPQSPMYDTLLRRDPRTGRRSFPTWRGSRRSRPTARSTPSTCARA